MRPLLPIVLTAFLSPVLAPATWASDATMPPEDALFLEEFDSNLNEFLWKKRPIVVFADSDADPRFQEQLERLRSQEDALRERDVVILTDTDPTERSELRRKLRPRGFQLVLVGKDGDVKLRKPSPWTVRELNRTIDKIPLRVREIEERRGE
ncbi:DUF4174 domain-containing protein [Epibacterium ulvae]|uniref:DUF4174 domain-containing protein n=1 Tax=Epibacterium ulvae TaxID=1156985 RepID=UPI001BFCC4EA|nr:DUF4174 domain-containing protein [Epibacterium ulvae]MBT8155548.1 DUF4174 domain-containing protein [Epibacterium ulvae]